ncbi:DUF1707 domain-containing protein [Kibdelosporangium phytohabitans]|uniref:Uncharacterized protein n=1 Tax=Kibdelosporangium phytohabitans TaxID=860235 RepID=A0A0N9HXE9_9PSEU|nr:DUF1707 domain-containing protein [Kibdelosporangium phytohabitans]ALG08155.1 hypothetical protein AOZ06_15650 [Kibdelosporangium phytohabitans]MBE1470859.1 hypothetical protein [Kibdelosporangium phytohabitans]
MNDPDLVRIGTQERDEALSVLGDHFAQGRLPIAEYDDRVQKAVDAETRADLRPLFADLPQPHPRSLATAHAPQLPTVPTAPLMPPPLAPLALPPTAPPPALAAPTGVSWPNQRYRAAAGLLQLFLPFGIGRFYTGHTKMAVTQLALMFVGVGVFWCWIDGIILLARGGTDAEGRDLI